MCVPSKTKDINDKVFNTIAKKNEAKTMVKHISSDCKCKFNTAACDSNQNWNNETCQCECKNYRTFKNDYGCNPSIFICENGKYFIVDDLIVSYVTDTMAITKSTVLINSDYKKVRYKTDYILLFLLVIITVIVTFLCHYYTSSSKRKGVGTLTI